MPPFLPPWIPRFIPAHAGNTRSSTSASRVTAVHPRARGEHLDNSLSRGNGSGSSPRTRGTLEPPPSLCRASRFIPAHAGNTENPCQTMRPSAVHPRARGEHPDRGSLVDSAVRFIPAHAGNTHRPVLGARPTAVHPRARGEHVGYFTFSSSVLRFIPAHAGNTCEGRSQRPPPLRFIPAHAGNTTWSR